MAACQALRVGGTKRRSVEDFEDHENDDIKMEGTGHPHGSKPTE